MGGSLRDRRGSATVVPTVEAAVGSPAAEGLSNALLNVNMFANAKEEGVEASDTKPGEKSNVEPCSKKEEDERM
jgi:hypothetical protein